MNPKARNCEDHPKSKTAVKKTVVAGEKIWIMLLEEKVVMNQIMVQSMVRIGHSSIYSILSSGFPKPF